MPLDPKPPFCVAGSNTARCPITAIAGRRPTGSVGCKAEIRTGLLGTLSDFSGRPAFSAQNLAHELFSLSVNYFTHPTVGGCSDVAGFDRRRANANCSDFRHASKPGQATFRPQLGALAAWI